MSAQPNNVLDLRQVAEDRARQEKRPRRKFPRWSGTKHAASPTHNPSRSRFDRTRFLRETAKFVVLVGVVSGCVWGGWKIVQAAGTVGRVQDQAKQALQTLQAAGQALSQNQPKTAGQKFGQAANELQTAETTLRHDFGLPLSVVRTVPWAGSRVRSAEALLSAGREASEAGRLASDLIAAAPPVDPLPQVNTKGIISGNLGFLTPLLAQPDRLEPVIAHIEAARDALHQVQLGAVPAAYREQFHAWQLADASLIGSSTRLHDVVTLLTGLFGQAKPQEYLVVFENNDELRATGGFIGTFLLVKFDRGTFKVLDAPVTGPFDLTAQIPHTSLPPEPILSVAPYWTFHDANWFFDVPTSSDFLLDFYEQARGFRPQGVIYLTPALVEDLLRLTGPITPQGYQTEITADNFVRATELQVEFGYDIALNNPKEFLLDLIPALFKAMTKFTAPEALQAVAITLTQAAESNVLITSRATAVQDAVTRLGWDGALVTPKTGDSLAVVDTNLGGGKTDRVIDTAVAVTADIKSDVVNYTVAVHRQHHGQTDDPLTGQTNRDFIRVYAPASATFKNVSGAATLPAGFYMTPADETQRSKKLDQAEGKILVEPDRGLRITEESGRKVFGAWSLLAPGKSDTLTFTFSTPRTDTDWSLTWQKQPGAPSRDWQVTAKLAKGAIRSYSPTSGQSQKQSVSWKTDSSVSRVFSLVEK